ncbi:MAG: hypothetical protein GXO93_00945 [FCB group bacterium]|nr:hypothetical protein [FCB group bacterium]
MKTSLIKYYLLLAFSMAVIIGCGGPPEKQKDIFFNEKISSRKITAEAYLFDAKIKRRGKLNSFRLEVFQTDWGLALGGRGYLGKGAFKGVITADSLFVYFPTSNQYLYEPIDKVMQSFNCTKERPHINILKLFYNLPTAVINNIDASVIDDYRNKKRPQFTVTFLGCPWKIVIVYAQQKKGWRIKRFVFTDGKKNTLKAKRRTYKGRVKVPLRKFDIAIKTDAERIVL